jgi:phosphotriesterase-related protein
MTVLGAIAPEDLGVTLPHEHVLVDFVGADEVGPERYDADEVFGVVLPYLERVRELGCDALVECTPAYLARDPALLKRLSEAGGLHLLTNTGYYGAADDKFLPPHAFTETADELAARWLGEWQEGIGQTGVRPGFIKISVDAGALSEVDEKLVRAAARTHLGSGLTIASHTGDTAAAMDQLRVLADEGVDPAAFIWVHAYFEEDLEVHAEVARKGAWVEFDWLDPSTMERYVEFVGEMKERDLLQRVLISHDAGWYSVDEAGGGDFRPFDVFFADFVPALEGAGLGESVVWQLAVDNPREAFTVRVRPAIGS